MKRKKISQIVFLAFFISLPFAHAEGLNGEVMSIEGNAYLSNSEASHQVLKEGDLLKEGDTVEVDSGAQVDLAYDKDWNNVTRVEEKSKIKINSIYPISLTMNYGGVYAKLKELPSESTFEVQTPTAVSTVRGTEYRTTYSDGNTEVYNYSTSSIYVYGVDSTGERQKEPVVIPYSQKTQVPQMGISPHPPQKMSDTEFHAGERFSGGIENKVREMTAKGRVGKAPDINKVKELYKNKLEKYRELKKNKLVSLDKDAERPFRSLEDFQKREERVERVAGDRKSDQTQSAQQPQQLQGQPGEKPGESYLDRKVAERKKEGEKKGPPRRAAGPPPPPRR